MVINNRKYFLRASIFILCAFVFTACNTSKYVPKGKYLLSNNYIIINNKDFSSLEFENLLKQKPNKRILHFFRFHLGVYNLSKPESEKWMSKSLKKIGEEPVIFDETLFDKSQRQIYLYLKNKGYYNAVITDSVVHKKREVSVYYHIETGNPYRIKSVSYNISDSLLKHKIFSDTSNCLIRKGNVFDVDVLQNERMRIEYVLKNAGYFSFTKDFIFFEADSSFDTHAVNLVIGIKNPQEKDNEGNTKMLNHFRYKLRSIQVIVDKYQNTSSVYADTLRIDTLINTNINLTYHNNIVIKPALIARNIYVNTGSLYNQSQIDATYKSLNALRIFKFINITFSEPASSNDDSVKSLDCQILLTTLNFLSYQTDAELTNSSGIGVAGSIVYQYRNLFKGAEFLDLKINGATEAIKSKNNLDFKNTLVLGAEATVMIPKFLLPFKSEEFTRKYNPKTNISASYKYISQIKYLNKTVNLTFGYNWKGNKYSSFQINPVEINFVNLNVKDSSLILKNSSAYFRNIFSDHLISATNIVYAFNNQKIKRNIAFSYLRYSVEVAGNTLRLLSQVIDGPRTVDGNYWLFGIKFAQYIKSDIDVRYYQPVNTTDKLVYRFFAGAAYPYKNSIAIPYEKQYFSGGANSIRAWKIASLGPGGYKDISNSAYPDLRADVKIEANFEYRFKLFWKLEGALFIDAGNIWAIHANDVRSDAQITLASFPKQIAIGSGLGARIDFSFFIFRLDLGFKMRDPAKQANQRWFFNNTIHADYFNPTFGIGYPF